MFLCWDSPQKSQSCFRLLSAGVLSLSCVFLKLRSRCQLGILFNLMPFWLKKCHFEHLLNLYFCLIFRLSLPGAFKMFPLHSQQWMQFELETTKKLFPSNHPDSWIGKDMQELRDVLLVTNQWSIIMSHLQSSVNPYLR